MLASFSFAGGQSFLKISSTCLTNPWLLSTSILYCNSILYLTPAWDLNSCNPHLKLAVPTYGWVTLHNEMYDGMCFVAMYVFVSSTYSCKIQRTVHLWLEQVRLFTATHAWSAQLLGNKVQLLRKLDNFGPNWSKQRCQDMYSTPPWRFQKSFWSTMSTFSQNAPHLCLVFPHLCLCLQTIALFSRLLCNSRPLDIPSAYTSVLMTLPYVILSAHGLLYANIFHQYSVAIAWCIPATSGPKIYIYTVHIYYDICTSYLLILVLILVPSWSSKLMIVTKLDWLEWFVQVLSKNRHRSVDFPSALITFVTSIFGSLDLFPCVHLYRTHYVFPAYQPQPCLETKKESGQWSFLVPLIGGRWYVSPQLAVYTTYIPLLYCLLGDYISPTTY